MKVEKYTVGKKDYWKCRIWYYKNGKKKSKYKQGFERERDAKTWGREHERKLKGLAEGADKTTVREFLKRWIKTKEDKLSPTTISGYKVNIEHINKYIGDTQMYGLKLIDIQEMLDELSKKGLKYRTVSYVYRTLRAALNYAVKTEMIEKNPCVGVEIKPDEEQFEAKVYTAEDLQKLLELLKEQEHHLYMPVFLASLRGLRRGECLGLRIADIDFKEEIATIKNNYVVVEGQAYNRTVKSKRQRIIDISGPIKQEIEEYIKKAKRPLTYLCEIGPSELPHPSTVSKHLKAFQEANGLPECRFHDLRHTFAELQIENGTDIETLKELLGHSTISITSNIYLHQNISRIKKASAAVDNVIYCDKIVTKSKTGNTG